ncbi:MAG TPA: malto-oligosyltrehalose trehalohydrolase [Terriglobales bacterium]|nr:malto-oligosyltrehalose trehalohydrolase [Terriglobales bacterium]
MNPTFKEAPATSRTLAVGPELQPSGGTHFRVWAPKRRSVDVVLLDSDGRPARQPFPLEAEDNGYFSVLISEASAGARYKLRLDDRDTLPDPASHFQPEGPHGPSEIVDHQKFQWTDSNWRGISIRGQVIYELHIGTFTGDGTYESAKEKLPLLKDLGITVIEIMPVASFPGDFGWGYDGVDLYAPYQGYGSPDDLRSLIDYAHSIGLGVILDVVYNHLGPDGNYLTQFSDDYFHREHATEWGNAINFDGENSEPVREFFAGNVEYWIREFHFDGLRFDATQAMHDRSRTHILAEMARRARAAAGNREVILVAENESQEAKIAKPNERGGYGFDALWNDDFHHSSIAALTGCRSAYYTDYLGAPQEFISAVKYGYLYQGQYYSWQKKRRGEPTLGMEPPAFVTFIENHDQVSNSLHGKRLHQLTSPARFRTMTALMLLAPGTPLLFQGQEFGSSKPFVFFAHHNPDLAKLVYKGRAEFLSQFPALNTQEMRERVPNPAQRETLEMCRLDWSERKQNSQMVALHRNLLQLRHSDPAFRMQAYGKVDGAVIGPEAFVLRYFVETGQDRLLVINLGVDLTLLHAPEPLLAPPEGSTWQTIWSSEDIAYGGSGFMNPDSDQGWRIHGQSATVLSPVRLEPGAHAPGNSRRP